VIVAVSLAVRIHGEQQFSYLALSFLQGKTYFVAAPGNWADTVAFEGRHYWPLGPFPAVILMPFVWTTQQYDVFFSQGSLQIPLLLALMATIFRIARRFATTHPTRCYSSWAFASRQPFSASRCGRGVGTSRKS
jgi:hypothetical protein